MSVEATCCCDLFYTDKVNWKYWESVYSDCLLLQLRSGGSQILEGCIAEIPNITSLDISDNGVEILLLVLKLLLYLL